VHTEVAISGLLFLTSGVQAREGAIPMAMNLGSKGSLKADINVTPLVDVMLVLLIIMMLIAPLLRGVPLALPEAHNSAPRPDTDGQTVVAIDSQSRFYVNFIPTAADDLVARVQRALEGKKGTVVYVKGDKDARYASIMDAMDALRAARIDNIALITERRPDRAGRTNR
jgi:biopolymer transport protein ExbD